MSYVTSCAACKVGERILVSLFVGWYLKRSISYEELTNYGLQKAPYYPVYLFVLRYVAPVAISLIFIRELGWLG